MNFREIDVSRRFYLKYSSYSLLVLFLKRHAIGASAPTDRFKKKFGPPGN